MEIVIAAFIGLWLSGFALWGYIRLKKDYKDINNNASAGEGKTADIGSDKEDGK